MKPITVDNVDGRTLLALRAGPMTAGELSARNGSGVAGWLIKAGYITQDDSFYRITEAGRAACPYRNPLAAPGVVPPATYKPEIDMSRETVVTRQQVLAAIVAAGQTGISPKFLIAAFGCSDSVIYNHINLLSKQQPPVIFKPKNGLVCGIQFKPAGTPVPEKPKHATREAILECLTAGKFATPAAIAAAIGCTEQSTLAVLRGLFAGMTVDRVHDADLDDYRYFRRTAQEHQHETPAPEIPAVTTSPESPFKTALKSPLTVEPALSAGEVAEVAAIDLENLAMPPEAFETIKVEAIPGRCGPFSMVIEEADFEAGIYSDGTLNLVIDDGLQDAQINFSAAALKKLRVFLGLFQEAA